RFTGFYSALLLASTPFVYSYSTKILSGIPSAFFVLLGVYLFVSNKKIKSKTLFFCGAFLGLSFLTRFPQGIAFGVLALFVFLSNIKNIKIALKNSIALFSGFSLIVAPYIIYNFYAYGNALLPFFAASRIIDATAWFHKSGVFFYAIELFYSNPFFIFLVFGIAYMLYQKPIQKMHILIGFLFLAYFSYFSFFLEAKELRFSLIFLPYVALIASLGMNCLLKTISVKLYRTDAIKKLKASNAKNVFTVLFITVSFITASFGFITLNSSHLHWLEVPQTQDPYNEFLLFVENHSTNENILTSNPTIAAYTDSRVLYLRGWVAAGEIYAREKDTSSTLIIDTCALDCAPDDFICHESKEIFITKMKNENTELFSTAANITGRLCEYSVYEINKS
ncbi:MAG: glycosyltransferase family 39 protein, partial [Candidatus Aenigmarchaeota archaeon]|nr:glycosyltransferase family 39 protein [Candidatus Aenigmarchaeota archaeon]